MASGYLWSERRLHLPHTSLIALGVMIATLTGAAAWAMGWPFLTSGYRYLEVWPLDKIELTTASVFDLGVFFCVLGAVLLSLASLSRFAQHTTDRTPLDKTTGDKTMGDIA
jgi:multicomponent K+:H+ antiporter subunit A